MPPPRSSSPAAFRGDIEGLRAIAIGVVLLAHAGVGPAEGGYVGVDVFFVISGFLITQVLVRELERTGSVSLTRFFAGRVKRLMPQVLTVIAAVAVASSLLLSPVRADAVASDVMAAGMYAMNWRLSAGAVDYFAAGDADRPLDHLWSLAVEEQFYLAWPLLLLVIAWSCRRRTGARGALVVVLAAIAAASFLLAVRQSAAAPEQAYFSALARAWELAVGGLLALALLRRRLGRRPAVAAAWAGATAIAAATLLFDAGTPVPGAPALLPALGAAALLAAGTSRMPAAPTRALAARGLRYVGRISYAWYVWHWPALVFAAAAWGPLPAAGGVAVTLASLVPTLFTHRWIEEPLRRSKAHLRRPRTILFAALAGPAAAVASGVALSASLSSPAPLSARDAEGAGQLARTGHIQSSATALRPRPQQAREDRGRAYSDGCLVPERAVKSPPCAYGDRRSRTTVVLFGDSHAMQFFPALDVVARRRGWRLVNLTKAGCPPAAVHVVSPLSRREYPQCDAWREYALRRIERSERPAIVVAGGSAHHTVIASGRRLDGAASARALGEGYRPVLRRLRASAGEVAVLTDPPRTSLDVPGCVSGALDDLGRCAFERRPAVGRAQSVAAAAQRVDGVRTVDATDQFCLPDLCPSVIGDVLVYRNSGHVTASFARTLAPWLGRRLAPARGASVPRS